VQTRVRKWGNSLGLRIPRRFAVEAGVAAGSVVDLSVHQGELRVRAVHPRRLSLTALLRNVTRRNLRGWVKTKDRVGREIW
jgi:antitoxin MazE